MAENDQKENAKEVEINQENNTQQQEKKLGFFKKVAYSITKFEKYAEMAAEGTPRAFKYLVQIMIVFSIIVALGLVYQFNMTVQKGTNYIQNDLPEITYNDGNLNVNSEEEIIIDTDNSIVNKVIIDTNIEDEEQIDKYVSSIPSEDTGVVVLKDKVIVKSRSAAEGIQYTYSDVLNSISNQELDNLTKQDILNYVTGEGMASIYAMFFVLMFVYVFVVYLVSVLVDTVVLAILGNITILFTKLRLKFSAVYNMAVYSLTLSIILNAIYIVVNMLTGFEVKYFQIMYTSIAYIYLVAAIFIIRSDFVKKQAELMKIIEEQEKVRKEMKEQQRKEEEEKQKENKTPERKEEKEEKKEEKQEEKSEDDSEPSGSEA